MGKFRSNEQVIFIQAYFVEKKIKSFDNNGIVMLGRRWNDWRCSRSHKVNFQPTNRVFSVLGPGLFGPCLMHDGKIRAGKYAVICESSKNKARPGNAGPF